MVQNQSYGAKQELIGSWWIVGAWGNIELIHLGNHHL